MKIAFRLDADNTIGMGHIVRCSALAESLETLGGACTFFCRPSAESVKYLQQRNFACRAVPVLSPAEETQFMLRELKGYDICILDSYQLSSAYIDALSSHGTCVCCIDDTAMYEYSCHILLNSTLLATAGDFTFGRRVPQLLLGGQYCLLRREFQQAGAIPVREKANRVFVCMGGADPNGLTPFFVEVLQDIPGIEVVAVLGAMCACGPEVARVAKANTAVFTNPRSMHEVMQGCDIGIIAAGQLLYEACAIGLPSLTVIQADNQEPMADWLHQRDLLPTLGWHQSIDRDGLRSTSLALLNDYARRERLSAKLQQIVARDGARRAAHAIKTIWSETGSIRSGI